MTKTKQVKSITIIGRRWFQRTYGNTYCSAEIIVNGESVGKVGPTYGYGDYYVQAAADKLRELGLISADNGTPLWSYCRDNGIALSYSASDVRRERDL